MRRRGAGRRSSRCFPSVLRLFILPLFVFILAKSLFALERGSIDSKDDDLCSANFFCREKEKERERLNEKKDYGFVFR